MASLQALGPQTQGNSLSNWQSGHKGAPALSPGDNYRQLVEAVTLEFSKKGWSRPVPNSSPQIFKIDESIFQIKESKTSLNAVVIKVVAIGTPLVGGALRVFGLYFSPAPKRLRSFSSASTEKTHSDLSPVAKASVAGALITGVTAIITGMSYHRFGKELRADILRTYNGITDGAVNQAALLKSANEILTKKEVSLFNKIFEYYNPNENSSLLLAKGIALDSGHDFTAAQQQYRAGLQYATDSQIKNILFYALARSLRLSGADQTAVLVQVNKIAQDSLIREIALIESQAAGAHANAVFDEDQIPFVFRCPITLSTMHEPTFYNTVNGRRYYERVEIEAWIRRGGASCPETRIPLALNQLVKDDRLAEVIKVWNRLKLKNG